MNRALLLLLCCAFSTHAQVAPAGAGLYEFQDDELSLVLRTLARHGNIQLVLTGPLTGTVTLRAENKTPREVIDILTTSRHLVVEEHEGILSIGPGPFRFAPFFLGLLALASFLGGGRGLRTADGNGRREALGAALLLLGLLCFTLCLAFARGWFYPRFV